jgi:hypothetical protein
MMDFITKKTVTIMIATFITGCSSLPPEPSIPMDQINNSGTTNYSHNNTLNLLKKHIKVDYSRIGDSPVRPLVQPMILMPIWIPEDRKSSSSLKGGHWIYESVDDGGVIDR